MVKLLILICLISAAYSASINDRKLIRVVRAPTTAKTAVEGIKEGAGLMKSIVDAIGKDGYKIKKLLVGGDKFLGIDMSKIKKLMDFAAKIGPILGVVGPAFALISVFLPEAPSEELKAIKAGFEKVDLRFDIVDRKLSEILDSIEKNIAYDNYKDNQDLLREVLHKYQQYLRHPQANITIRELKTICKNPRNDPHTKLHFIFQHVSEPQMDPQLLPSMLKDSKYDAKKLSQLSTIVMADATRAAFLRQVCLAMMAPNSTNLMEDNANEAQGEITRIAKSLADLSKELVSTFHERRLETDLLEKLEAWKETKDHSEFAKKLKTYLSDKYNWLHWGVHVYDPIEGFQVHKTWYYTDSAMMVLRKNGRNILVNWSNKDNLPQSERLLTQIVTKINSNCVGGNSERLADHFKNLLEPYNMLLIVDPSAKVGHAEDPNTRAGFWCGKYIAVSA